MSEERRELSGNIDEVIAQMELEDAQDATKLSPREYGLSRGIKPQLVYYYIKKAAKGGKGIALEKCICGRNVIDVKAAEDFFRSREASPHSADGEDV